MGDELIDLFHKGSFPNGEQPQMTVYSLIYYNIEPLLL